MGLSALLAIIKRDGVANFGRACLAFPFMNDIIDNFDEDDSLGHVEIPLHHLQPMKQQDTWYKLLNDRVKGQPENNGQLHVMCKLIPKLPPAVLQIEILRTKDLIAADAGGTSDPYVRVHVGDEIGDAVKTSVKKKTLAPEWNER